MFVKKITKKYFSFFFYLIILITCFGGYFLFHLNSHIKRGIDLVGGSYVVLNVKMDPLFKDILIEAKNRIEREGSFKIQKMRIIDNSLSLLYESEKEKEIDISKLKELKLGLLITESALEIILTIDDITKENMLESAININIQTLRKRLDPFGTGELLIARQQNNIILEIPSVYDQEQTKRLIGATANLNMKVVLDSSQKKEKLIQQYEDMLEYVSIVKDKDEKQWYVVSKEAQITGALLKKAYVGYNPERGNEPIVQFEFNSLGATKFKEMTEKNKNKQIAIIIDDEVITAPVVNTVIPDGKGFIQGNFSVTSAQELVVMLESGSFAAPVVYMQERVIAPLLGEKTIQQGLLACLVGLIALFFVLTIYYKFSGFLAFLVLLYNLLFSLIGMWLLGATLTLSGLAGLILTIGMAVDSSILLFERIKEDLLQGKSFAQSFEIAFTDGITVILDANVTHFLVALVLYYVGAGPLKGFASTMIIGIISTLLSGILLLKSFMKYILYNLQYSKISI